MFNTTFRLIDQLPDGKIHLHYGQGYEEVKFAERRLALRLVKQEDSIIEQLPGYFLPDNTFVEEALRFGRFELIKITEYRKTLSAYVEISFRLFNDSVAQFRHFKLKHTGHAPQLSVETLIDTLNRSIEAGLDINSIDESTILKHYKLIERIEAIEAFSELNITHFCDSMNRVGKDNLFWREAELYNISKDKYVSSLLLSSLKKWFEVKIKENFVLLVFGHDYAWAASDDRSQEKESQVFRFLFYKSIVTFSQEYNELDRFITNVSRTI